MARRTYNTRKEFYTSKVWEDTTLYIWKKQSCICAMCHRPVYVSGLTPYLPKKKRLVGAVHHIEELTDFNFKDDSIALNEDNLIGLCQDCHASKHSSSSIRNDVMFDEYGNLIKRK